MAEPAATVHVTVNGTDTEVARGTSVDDLLVQLGLDGRWVVVERNREPMLRRDLATTVLVDGDRVELVRAVAGG
ncbi:MAG: sulfur carrier protein ThiS [Acidimicrobiia bacterium]